MESTGKVVARDEAITSSTTVNLLIAVLSLVFFGLILFALLVLFRKMRRQRQMRHELLPSYHEVAGSRTNLAIHAKGMHSASGRTSVIYFKDGEPMLSNPESPPHSPDNVPQIHITFPDEHDDQGRRKSGRVVVVRVGETSVGLEPLHEEQLPAYEKESKSQFYAIDMDQIGGLKEKPHRR